MKIRDVMGTAPQEIGPGATIREAAREMARLAVGALIVLDGRKRIAGIVTERDVLLKVVAEGRDPDRTTVRDVMTSGVERVGPDDDLETAYRKMAAGRFRHLPVAVGDRVVGFLSLRTLLETRDRQRAEELAHLRGYILGERGGA